MSDILTLFIVGFVGFFAQLIDGVCGMGYGVISTSFLLFITKLTPSIISAIVHTAEVPISLTSGLSHFKFGNVDKKLFKSLVIPGCIAAVLGVYLLVSLPLWFIQPAINFYLIIMGCIILLRAFGINLFMRKINRVLLGCLGGFIDSLGGGWGPVVTSTLIANGEDPKKTIGSVNLSEFFITITQSATFFLLIGLINLNIIIAFLIGGLIAAPLGAYLCKRIDTKILMIIVGILIIFLNIRTFLI
jgi:uncharacterized membrane protein YfcA